MSNLSKQQEDFFMVPSFLNDFFPVDRFFSDDFFPRNSAQRMPAVNISEDDKAYHLQMATPGMDKNDLKIKLENGLLQISGEKKQEQNESKGKYTRREFHYGSFSRSFRLPEDVQAEQLEAVFENGLLKLDIPKKAAGSSATAKEIKIA